MKKKIFALSLLCTIGFWQQAQATDSPVKKSSGLFGFTSEASDQDIYFRKPSKNQVVQEKNEEQGKQSSHSLKPLSKDIPENSLVLDSAIEKKDEKCFNGYLNTLIENTDLNSIKKLAVHSKNFDLKKLSHLGSFIEKFKNLKSLDFSSSKIFIDDLFQFTEKKTPPFMTALKKQKNLVFLSVGDTLNTLSTSVLRNDAINFLAEMIMSNENLKELSLTGNSIDNDGLNTILKACQQHKSLEILDLSAMGLNFVRKNFLRDTMNTKETGIQLHENKCSIEILEDFFSNNKKLKVLNFNGNRIQPSFNCSTKSNLKLVLHSLGKNTSLKRLYLHDQIHYMEDTENQTNESYNNFNPLEKIELNGSNYENNVKTGEPWIGNNINLEILTVGQKGKKSFTKYLGKLNFMNQTPETYQFPNNELNLSNLYLDKIDLNPILMAVKENKSLKTINLIGLPCVQDEEGVQSVSQLIKEIFEKERPKVRYSETLTQKNTNFSKSGRIYLFTSPESMNKVPTVITLSQYFDKEKLDCKLLSIDLKERGWQDHEYHEILKEESTDQNSSSEEVSPIPKDKEFTTLKKPTTEQEPTAIKTTTPKKKSVLENLFKPFKGDK